jgi:hypothetical protein
MKPDRLTQVLEKIDLLNSEDPNTDMVGGKQLPREVVYSRQLTEWVLRLNPGASEELRIAARGQHVCRWAIPRDRFDMTRQGYLRWRETLKQFHIDKVSTLMQEVGYSPDEIDRVRRIMNKRELPQNRDSQTLEDALCLVFLDFQFHDFRKKTDDMKVKDILRKTWKKMSEQGHAAALQLALSPEDSEYIKSALSAG